MDKHQIQYAPNADEFEPEKAPYTAEQLEAIKGMLGTDIWLHEVIAVATHFKNNPLGDNNKIRKDEINSITKEILSHEENTHLTAEAIKADLLTHIEYEQSRLSLTSDEKEKTDRKLGQIANYAGKIVDAYGAAFNSPYASLYIDDADYSRLMLLYELAKEVSRHPLPKLNHRAHTYQYPALRSFIWQLADIYEAATGSTITLRHDDTVHAADEPDALLYRGPFFSYLCASVLPLEPMHHPTPNKLGDFASNVIQDRREVRNKQITD